MNITHRINLLVQLRDYLLENAADWQKAKALASRKNGWFVPAYIELAIDNVVQQYLNKEKLQAWVESYKLQTENIDPKTVGIVMAGNIPMVGFHDLLCGFITGNRLLVKTSSKDDVLIPHIVEKLYSWDRSIQEQISFAQQLKGCSAYIATGSNNTSRYFDFYFGKYPSIIRKNRTSVAILDGNETKEELVALADDIMLYFGLGCRNVTQIQVPRNYDFIPLLQAFHKYDWAKDHHSYRNNYDYNLALHMLNNTHYMTNDIVLIFENPAIFSPISQLHYQWYDHHPGAVLNALKLSESIQAVVGHYGIPFGRVQMPALTDYADGVDTILWLKALHQSK